MFGVINLADVIECIQKVLVVRLQRQKSGHNGRVWVNCFGEIQIAPRLPKVLFAPTLEHADSSLGPGDSSFDLLILVDSKAEFEELSGSRTWLEVQ